jgi:hypothetical protein
MPTSTPENRFLLFGASRGLGLAVAEEYLKCTIAPDNDPTYNDARQAAPSEAVGLMPIGSH